MKRSLTCLPPALAQNVDLKRVRLDAFISLIYSSNALVIDLDAQSCENASQQAMRTPIPSCYPLLIIHSAVVPSTLGLITGYLHIQQDLHTKAFRRDTAPIALDWNLSKHSRRIKDILVNRVNSSTRNGDPLYRRRRSMAGKSHSKLILYRGELRTWPHEELESLRSCGSRFDSRNE